MMSEIYRDPVEGAAARRDHLLRHRRDELAELPHALRRVIVARSARIGASVVAVAIGAALVALALAPSATAAVAHALPGRVAVLTALLAAVWIAAPFAWWVARARAEHRYATAMSRLVLPGDDLDHDLQRLDHERPDVAARAMALRLERRSIALPVLAAALVVPATAVYLFALARAGTWPMLAHVEDRLAGHAEPFALIALAGACVAFAAARIARSTAAATSAGALGVVWGLVAVPVAFDGPGSLAFVLLAAGAIGAPLLWAARRLQAERAAIRVDGAVPIRELTLRDVAVAIRGALCTTRRAAARHRHASAVTVAAVVSLFGGLRMWEATHRAPDTAPVQPAFAQPSPIAQPTSLDLDTYTVTRLYRDSVRVDVTTAGGISGTLDASPVAELQTVPAGWHATLVVTPTVDVDIAAFGADATRHVRAGTAETFEASACGTALPMSLHVTGYTQPLSLEVAPFLRLAPCPSTFE